MLKIEFDFDTEGATSDDAFLDPYEIELMFEQTRQSLQTGLQRKLAGVTCPEHGKAPHIIISGRYNNETEDMDLNYNIDTCCKLFLVQVVKTLNNVG